MRPSGLPDIAIGAFAFFKVWTHSNVPGLIENWIVELLRFTIHNVQLEKKLMNKWSTANLKEILRKWTFLGFKAAANAKGKE